MPFGKKTVGRRKINFDFIYDTVSCPPLGKQNCLKAVVWRLVELIAIFFQETSVLRCFITSNTLASPLPTLAA
jgi:hypothetical protein